jgi:hypothetical protein
MDELEIQDILSELSPEGVKEWESAVLRAQNKAMRAYIMSLEVTPADEVGQDDK